MKKVVLTFDDGPWQATTPHVLEIKKRCSKAPYHGKKYLHFL